MKSIKPGIASLLVAIVLMSLACGGDDTGMPTRPQAPKTLAGKIGLSAIVEISDRRGAAIDRDVNVIITAVNQYGEPQSWLDVESNIIHRYPLKTTQKTHRYMHPIYFLPGAVVTATITVTLIGHGSEVAECYFVDNIGVEVAGSRSKKAITETGTANRGAVDVTCTATIS